MKLKMWERISVVLLLVLNYVLVAKGETDDVDCKFSFLVIYCVFDHLLRIFRATRSWTTIYRRCHLLNCILWCNFYAVSTLKSLMSTWKNTPPEWEGTDPCEDWEGIKCRNTRVTSM